MLLLGILAGLLIFAAAITYSALSWGFVMFKFWYWFLIPVFTTIPQIDYWQAIGLMLFLSLFKSHSNKRKIKDEFLEGDKLTPWVVGILSPWLSLGIGYIIYSIIN